ncbi:MAG: anhydro-N-acetylmuramic acid kinase [Gemmatimonadales bacterium]|jgi:anhydro-N-acetylmuramic acid kinase|nr:anhydro-N-acetylmuramic acid kinase [Gemmatimonadales bacterium]
MSERPTLGVGLMSGTSLDGMDAALVRFESPTRVELLDFVSRAYARDERELVLEALRVGTPSALAALHVTVAEWAAEATDALLAQARVPASALAFLSMHGQTVWHQPPRVSWQLGEPALLAERFGVPVVSNFRARDVAAGGEGAPLVPMADVLLFGAADGPRTLLNLGGMANLTWVPRRAQEEGVLAFDTGPGVAVIDAVARLVAPDRPFDVDGALAGQGRPDERVLDDLLADPFFQLAPPRSTGRERFGEAYAQALHARVPGADGVATAVALTARSVAAAIARWVPAGGDILVSGGGLHHPVLQRALAAALAAHGRPSPNRFDEHFFDGDAKEAVAFALLGYLTLHGQPGNVPAATGASGPRVLGSITPP